MNRVAGKLSAPALLTYVFLPAEGPRAKSAADQTAGYWRNVVHALGLIEYIPRLGVPTEVHIPPEMPLGGTGLLAAASRSGPGVVQALLRAEDDLIVMTVMHAPADRGDCLAGWKALLEGDQVPLPEDRVGSAQVLLGLRHGEVDLAVPGDTAVGWRRRVDTVLLPDGGTLPLWEIGIDISPARRDRRLLGLTSPDSEAVADNITWTTGDGTLSPLGGHLAQAAKLRYQLRVLRMGALRERLDDALRRVAPAGDIVRLAEVTQHRLTTMRTTVDRIAGNLDDALDHQPGDGPLDDDIVLVRDVRERLDDELERLSADIAAVRGMDPCGGVSSAPSPPVDHRRFRPVAVEGPSTQDLGLGPDRTRNVFVAHGRDRKARRAFFDFLRSLDLKPLEWNKVLDVTGHGSPFIGDVLDKGMDLCQAVVVLMTPDDVVRLKPQFLKGTDDPDRDPIGQARPNVLFEAGFALARYPERTVLVEFGKVRRLSDISGRYVHQLTGSVGSRQSLAQTLIRVGCTVDTGGSDWLTMELVPPDDDAGAPAPGTPAPEPSRTPASTATAQSDVLTLDNINVIPGHGSHSVHGEATNTSSASVTAVLGATFYDATSKIVGSASGVVSGVSPGSTKAFQLLTYDSVENHVRVVPQVTSYL